MSPRPRPAAVAPSPLHPASLSDLTDSRAAGTASAAAVCPLPPAGCTVNREIGPDHPGRGAADVGRRSAADRCRPRRGSVPARPRIGAGGGPVLGDLRANATAGGLAAPPTGAPPPADCTANREMSPDHPGHGAADGPRGPWRETADRSTRGAPVFGTHARQYNGRSRAAPPRQGRPPAHCTVSGEMDPDHPGHSAADRGRGPPRGTADRSDGWWAGIRDPRANPTDPGPDRVRGSHLGRRRRRPGLPAPPEVCSGPTWTRPPSRSDWPPPAA